VLRVICKSLFLLTAVATLVLVSGEKAQARPDQACVNSCWSAQNACISGCVVGYDPQECIDSQCRPAFNACMQSCGAQ